MEKSHIAGWVSDSPTPAQLKEFFSQVTSGRVTKARLQAFLRDKSVSNLNSFPVTVDCSKTLDEMIADGDYDWTNPNINANHFPPDAQTGKVAVNVGLLHFNWDMETDTVLTEIDRLG